MTHVTRPPINTVRAHTRAYTGISGQPVTSVMPPSLTVLDAATASGGRGFNSSATALSATAHTHTRRFLISDHKHLI